MTTTSFELSIQEKMVILVQGVQSGFARVADSVGMNYKLRKEGVALVKKLPDACVIASIGTVGKIRGGIAISFDREGLSACVSAMSGGMLAGDPDDPMSVSCIGELVNMTGGGVAMFASEKGVEMDVTPPQIFSGENISQSWPTQMHWVSVPYIVRDTGNVFLNVFASDS